MLALGVPMEPMSGAGWALKGGRVPRDSNQVDARRRRLRLARAWGSLAVLVLAITAFVHLRDREESRAATALERRATLLADTLERDARGLPAPVLPVRDVLAAAVRDAALRGMHVRVVDTDRTASYAVLWEQPASREPRVGERRDWLVWERELDVPARSWMMRVSAGEELVASHRGVWPWTALAGGFLLAALPWTVPIGRGRRDPGPVVAERAAGPKSPTGPGIAPDRLRLA
jgi:hypothetical protein